TGLALTHKKKTKKSSKSARAAADDTDDDDDGDDDVDEEKRKKKKTAVVKDTRTPRTKAREKWIHEEKNNKTPLANTRASRSAKLRQKVFALVGRVACLVTGMSFEPHFLHVAHIIARSLTWTHWWLYEALLQDIGIPIYDKNGHLTKKVLNLDTSVNQEILVSWIHLLFDGTSVRTNMGKGVLAFVPENLDEILALIRENKGEKSYLELCPNRVHLYKLRCFSTEEFFYGRYENAERTYDHLPTDEPPTFRQNEEEERKLDEEHPMQDDGEHGADHASSVVSPEEVPETIENFLRGRCHARVFRLGDQPETFVSHMHPILATHNLVQKMRYRMSKKCLHRHFPEEWVDHYNSVMQPSTAHWFPTEEEALARRAAERKAAKEKLGRTTNNSNREQVNPAAHSGEEASVLTPPPGEATPSPPTVAPPEPPSSPPPESPLGPSSSSPLGEGINCCAATLSPAVPPQNRLPRLDVQAAMATRDSSPPAPQETTPATTRPPWGFRHVKPLAQETTSTRTGHALSMPDPARRIKTLPKRAGKTLPTGTVAPYAAPAMTPLNDPPDKASEHDFEQLSEIIGSTSRPTKAPDKLTETPAPVPKALDKTNPATAVASDAQPHTDPPPPTDDPSDPPPTRTRRSSRVTKAPDKISSLAEAPGHSSAAQSALEPPTLGGQPPGGRMTRSATKRNAAEAL
ncbi:hypothetical protein HDZ31DRAFT_78174, partial [Schizophyllum fasciatum]